MICRYVTGLVDEEELLSHLERLTGEFQPVRSLIRVHVLDEEACPSDC